MLGRNARILARDLRQYGRLTVALDEVNRNLHRQQAPKCFPRHRTRDDITADRDPVGAS